MKKKNGFFSKDIRKNKVAVGKKNRNKSVSGEERRFLTPEQMLQSVMYCVTDYMIVFDDDERVRYISESAIKKFGLKAEAQERTIADFSKLRLNGHTLGELLMIVDRNSPLEEMVRIETRDYLKEPWWAAVNVYRLTGDNGSGGFFVLLKDVTEYLKKTEKEAESNLIQENLLYTVSHCVKNSLNAIVGTVDLMEADKDEGVNEEHLEVLRDSSEKMAAMLEEIVDFTKAESGKLELRERGYEVVPMLEQLYSYERQAKEHGKQLFFFISTDIPRVIIGDAKRMQQAIANLLYFFTARPGKGSRGVELHITTEEHDVAEIMLRVEVRGSTATMPNIIQKNSGKGNAYFHSYDSGELVSEFKYYAVVDLVRLMGGEVYSEQKASGITVVSFVVPLLTGSSENIIAFQEFKGTKIAISSEDENLFMHLVRIARELSCEIVKAENAEFIWSEETLKAPYSTMIVTDYMREKRNAVQGKPTKKKPVLTGVEKVSALIVDDNEVNCMVAKKLFSTLGITSEIANNGIQAVEMAEKKKYDIILMDHLMPEMDGVTATERIREVESGENKALIIALTASLMDSVVKLFEQAGADVTMAKPMALNKLKKVLTEYLPVEKQVFGEEKLPGENARTEEPKTMNLSSLKSDELKQIALVCPEIDMTKGLSYVMGDEDQYLRVLTATKNSLTQILEQLEQLLFSETEEIRIAIHSLKGIFANVGAETLWQEAMVLEQELTEKKELQKEEYTKFFSRCKVMETKLKQNLPTVEVVENTILSEAEKEEWKATAKKALALFEYDIALEAARKLAAAAEGKEREVLLCAVEEINNFNYESALELLEQVH